MRRDSSTAAVIAAVLATIALALGLPLPPGSSASAIDRAEADRFSICELAADSERNSTAANGAISAPSSASKRAISWLASSACARIVGSTVSSKPVMEAGIAAWYGPPLLDARECGPS